MGDNERPVGGIERFTSSQDESGKGRERTPSPGRRFERKMDALLDMASLMMGKMGQSSNSQNNQGHIGEHSGSHQHSEYAVPHTSNRTNISSRPFKPTF